MLSSTPLISIATLLVTVALPQVLAIPAADPQNQPSSSTITAAPSLPTLSPTRTRDSCIADWVECRKADTAELRQECFPRLQQCVSIFPCTTTPYLPPNSPGDYPSNCYAGESACYRSPANVGTFCSKDLGNCLAHVFQCNPNAPHSTVPAGPSTTTTPATSSTVTNSCPGITGTSPINFMLSRSYGGRNQCVPSGYYQAIDNGQINGPAEAPYVTCESLCRGPARCGGFVIVTNQARDSPLRTTQCFFYETLPERPVSCADYPSAIGGYYKVVTPPCR